MSETPGDRTPEQVMAQGLVDNWGVGQPHDNESAEEREWRRVCAGDAAESDARAALEALREAGFAVVPVEPTDEMVQAGVAAYFVKSGSGTRWQRMTRAYRAAVAANEEGTDG